MGLDFLPQRSGDKIRSLNDLRRRHDAECPHCTSVTTHTQTVFGEGDPDAQIMFIGEAPGEEEDKTGRPFVGKAGQKLNEIIKAMGLSRDQVYIANVLKSRPPDNRTPLEHEVLACSPYLAEQIRIIQPQVIVALGGPASKMLLQTETGITRLRGLWGVYRDPQGTLEVPVMPTFHPAYLLRNYTTDTRQKVWADMQAVLGRLAGGTNPHNPAN
jgi:uracil-DNA glycosylase family 4